MDEAKKSKTIEEIQKIVDRETKAWDEKDAQSLVSIFHPDMVWPWPPDNRSHDPMTWDFSQGRYNRDRWISGWQELFDNYDLLYNRRVTLRIEVSAEGDGAFAVVDVDTLWRHRETKREMHWEGRTLKGYTKTAEGWKLIRHTGVLDYGER